MHIFYIINNIILVIRIYYNIVSILLIEHLLSFRIAHVYYFVFIFCPRLWFGPDIPYEFRNKLDFKQ